MQPKKKWKEPSAAHSSELTPEATPPPAEQLYESALKALARRPLPARELERKLCKSCNDMAAVSQVVERLKAAGYLDDRKFAEDFIQSSIRRKTQGKAHLQQELLSRGLDSAIVCEELEKAYPTEVEQTLLQRAIERKLRSLPPPMDAKKLSRLYNHLLRRGFPSDVIRLELRQRLEMELDSD
jgi:regulatory protein